MDLFEYQAKELFAKHGVPTTPGRVTDDAADARAIAEEIGLPAFIKTGSEIRALSGRKRVNVRADVTEALGIDRLIFLNQVHGNTVYRVDAVPETERKRKACN